MDTALRLEGITKRFGERTALEDVDLVLASGERLALLGPNGAGKTTLVRTIAGRVRPDAGNVHLLGRGLAPGTRSGREALGVVPQDIALYPLMSAQENLEVFGTLSGVRPEALADRVAWALDFTGLADRREDRVAGFSGGMKRRLNIACSILHRPAVVLLDEPTVGVDPQSRERIWEMLGELNREGASLVLTTHQLDEAEHQCDRIVIIDHGRTIANGTLAELVESTLGSRRRVTITLDRPWEGTAPEGFEAAGRALAGEIERLGDRLAGVLESLSGRGYRVMDLQVENASLHSVFLHLTGRELRE